MQLTDAQIELARTQPQQTRLYMGIFTPSTVMSAQIPTGTGASKGLMDISYTAISGSYSDVEAGMTLLIGNQYGGKDVGRIRIRSVTTGSFSVSENSNINWQDGQYLTVLKYWEIWPVYPRIIQDPSNEENVIFYKDYDIPYSSQNSDLGTLVCMGPNRAALLEGGTADIFYTSSGTYNILGNPLSYAWTFEGGTPSTHSSGTPGHVSYDTAGDYVARLIVTDTVTGVTDTSYRYVMIRDKFGEGPNTPIKRWKIEDINGSRGEGGYTLGVKIFDDISIDDNAVVVLFSEDWYGSTKQSLGGNNLNASNIVFAGYVDKGTLQYDYKHKEVQFDVTSITGIMKNSLGFSVSVQDDPSPDTWYKLLGLNVKRAIYHYLRWHTTILNLADVHFVGTDQKIQYFDSDRTSMFDAIDTLMRGTLIGSVCADRQGGIYAEVDPQAYSDPTGSFSPIMSIEKRDWMGMPKIDERLQDEYSYIEYGGIHYDGSAFEALLACAPGSAPSFRGKTEELQGLATGEQADLNTMIGNIFANKNARYKGIELQMTENLRNIDIAPQEAVSFHADAEDTTKGEAIDALLIPTDITWGYDAKNGRLLPTIMFKSLVNGIAGDTITIPIPQDIPGNDLPPVTVPPLPVLPPVIFGGVQSYVIITGDVTHGNEQIISAGGIWQGADTSILSYVSNTLVVASLPAGLYMAMMNIQSTSNKAFTLRVGASGGGGTGAAHSAINVNGGDGDVLSNAVVGWIDSSISAANAQVVIYGNGFTGGFYGNWTLEIVKLG